MKGALRDSGAPPFVWASSPGATIMEAETTINLDHDYSECIKAISNIGSTTYQNICDGTVSVIPWGSADWITSILWMVGVLLVLAIFASLAFLSRY